MSRKKVGIIFCAILAAAAAAAGIWYFFGNGGHDSKDRVYVEKVSVITGNITGVQNRYSGVVQPQETVEINAEAERTIGEVLVEVGDEVEVGTPLFNYDTEDLSLELEQAKLELENQDIEINNYRSQIQELEKERAAAAEANKFEYTTQIQTIQTQIKQAEFTKSSKQLEMDKLQKRVDNSQVVSTASGVVKSINDGQSPDDESSAFMTILSTGEFRIKGTVNEQNAGMIVSGAEVIVRSRVDESITWTGMIENLDTDESSDSSDDDMYGYESEDGMSTSSDYSFFVTLDDADGLMLGQHVLIELDEGQTEQKEGIWLHSGYIVFAGRENSAPGGMGEDMNFLPYGTDTEELWDYDDEDYLGEDDYGDDDYLDEDDNGDDDYLDEDDNGDDEDYLGDEDYEDEDDYGDNDFADGEISDMSNALNLAGAMDANESLDAMWIPDSENMGTEMLLENGEPAIYVWADNGNGRLEKRAVQLGEYDADLDKYQILSGLTEEDLIAWPMAGLYEGVKTVTNTEDIDYTSDLYNQENGTEDMWLDTEFDGTFDDDGLYEDGNNEDYEDGLYDDGNNEDYEGSYDDGNDEDYEEDYEGSSNENDIDQDIRESDDKPLDFDDFLKREGY